MSAADSVEARYQAKLASRANGTAKVTVTLPADVKPSPQGSDVDRRYAAKLAARAAASAVQAEPEAAAEAMAPAAEEKSAPVADKPKNR